MAMEIGIPAALVRVPLCGTLFHFLANARKSPYNQSSIGPGLRVAFNQEQT
jgi:hypothetical protein